jgi:sulfur relay (sulfurtransferase) complex TusBCD TusD component (DsrE family)
MDNETVLLFTRNGIGQAPEELSQMLVKKFLAVTLESGKLPAIMLFYTDGVKLACKGSVVLDELHAFEKAGVKLVLCQTCLNYFKLADQVEVGIVGGMGDIVEALAKASKVITL